MNNPELEPGISPEEHNPINDSEGRENTEGKIESPEPLTDSELEYLSEAVKQHNWEGVDSYDLLRSRLPDLREKDPDEADFLEDIVRRRDKELESLRPPLGGRSVSQIEWHIRQGGKFHDLKSMLGKVQEWLNLSDEDKMAQAQRLDLLYSRGETDVQSEENVENYRDTISRNEASMEEKVDALNKAIDQEQKNRDYRAKNRIIPELERAGIIKVDGDRVVIDMEADLSAYAREWEIPLDEIEEARERELREVEDKTKESDRDEAKQEEAKVTEAYEKELARNRIKLERAGIIKRDGEGHTVDMDADLAPIAEELGVAVEKMEAVRAKAFEDSEAENTDVDAKESEKPEEPTKPAEKKGGLGRFFKRSNKK